MRFAYADPPYPGMAHRYEEEAAADGRVAAEVDHAELIARLESDYDGWALSTSSVALPLLLPMCPPDVRIAAWCKSWASFKKGVNPAYAWEPVLFKGARSWKERGGDAAWTMRDWLVCPAHQHGFFGSKPPRFVWWLLDLLGVRRGVDQLYDLFPGSGAVGHAYADWLAQDELFGTVS